MAEPVRTPDVTIAVYTDVGLDVRQVSVHVLHDGKVVGYWQDDFTDFTSVGVAAQRAAGEAARILVELGWWS